MIGRHTTSEVSELSPGLDFRLPQYRREVFHRFYQFHLENRSHPGCVYYAFPWLQQRLCLDTEQMLWLAYLNGNTQNIVTSLIIFRRYPKPGHIDADWFNTNWSNLEWDTDRRYHKKSLISAVANYAELIGNSQAAYFHSHHHNDPESTFREIWSVVHSQFYTFGRLSTFSYLEYLRIVGQPLLCDQLFLHDMDGSKSHRNGLAKVLGRDDLDWHKSTGFAGDYTDEQLTWLVEEGALLLREAQDRTAETPAVPARDVNYFTLESALCTYKSWHRPRRRYPNCYNDMFAGRIRRAEERWGKEETALFWQMREDCVPRHLRLECCPNDPGLTPAKQDHYRLTGQPVMMSRRWPVFDNAFDRQVWT